MKKSLTLALLCGVLSANEIERIESIVNDVTKLRTNYEICQQKLMVAEAEVKSGAQVADTAKYDSNDLYKKKIAALEKALESSRENERLSERSLEHANTQIAQLQKLVSEQKQHIEVLSDVKPTQVVTKVVTKTVEVPKPCPDPNPFPKLMMKEEKTEPKSAARSGETVYFEACAFRVTEDSDIYDAPDGKVIERWEAKTSFTSNQKRDGWVRITGYFVEGKWRPSRDRTLWVREALTLKR
ncbi:MAG: hypothetical protein R3302_02715 [Sulfurimonadaceae bacterium]|nr:hypothetical protein [Sulfurimonadaceae bacterium]